MINQQALTLAIESMNREVQELIEDGSNPDREHLLESAISTLAELGVKIGHLYPNQVGIPVAVKVSRIPISTSREKREGVITDLVSDDD